MNFGEILLSVLLAVAGGAAGAAVINGINERWKFKANRKAVQGQLKVLKTSDTAQAEALRLILLDRVLYLGRGYIKAGEISYDDRRRFHAMHNCYHSGLGGNGDADLVVAAVDELPLKK